MQEDFPLQIAIRISCCLHFSVFAVFLGTCVLYIGVGICNEDVWTHMGACGCATDAYEYKRMHMDNIIGPPNSNRADMIDTRVFAFGYVMGAYGCICTRVHAVDQLHALRLHSSRTLLAFVACFTTVRVVIGYTV